MTRKERLAIVNDSDIMYGNGHKYASGPVANFSISTDDDPDAPEVNLHAHRYGVGGLFSMTPAVARKLALVLIEAADALEAKDEAKSAAA